MSGEVDANRLLAEVETLRSALAELAVTQAEGLNAVRDLADLVDFLLEGRRSPADLIYAEPREVAARARQAGARTLTVAGRLLNADDG
jgi:hypothetical protein